MGCLLDYLKLLQRKNCLLGRGFVDIETVKTAADCHLLTSEVGVLNMNVNDVQTVPEII